MKELTMAGLQSLLKCLRELYALSDAESFPQRVNSAVKMLVPCDVITYNIVDPRTQTNTYFSDPPGWITSELEVAFLEHLGEHPLIRHYVRTGDGRPLKFSDFLSQRQFQDLGIYTEFFRPLRLEHQMAVTIPCSGQLVIAVALNRQYVDFSEEERQMLSLVRPHLAQAFQNMEVVTALKRKPNTARIELVHMDRLWRAPFASERTRTWLEEYFQCALSPNSQLPHTLLQWAQRQQMAVQAAGEVPQVAGPLVIARGERRLVIHFILGTGTTSQGTLVVEERVNRPSVSSLASLGLTKREAEVMALLMQGWTNPHIARRLSISPRTVQKHLENIYAKLGVQTRAAAVALAFQA